MKIFILFLIIIFSTVSCKTATIDKSKTDVSFICVRDSDTLYLKINNNSGRGIFVPGLFNVCFNIDGDTLHLETLDKPKYSKDSFYRYKNLFPFGIYTGRKIKGQKEDSVVVVINSENYCYNQLKLRPFIKIEASSSYLTSIVFSIPKKLICAKVVFYENNFIQKQRYDSIGSFLSDFLHFDSVYAKYATAPIYNRFYLQDSSEHTIK